MPKLPPFTNTAWVGLIWCLIGALVVAVFALLTQRSLRLSRQQEHEAIAQCQTMHGEAIMSYSYNSDGFYLTGCKLR